MTRPVERIQPRDAYPGLTRIKLEGQRALVCMGVGPVVDAAMEAKLAKMDGREG